MGNNPSKDGSSSQGSGALNSSSASYPNVERAAKNVTSSTSHGVSHQSNHAHSSSEGQSQSSQGQSLGVAGGVRRPRRRESATFSANLPTSNKAKPSATLESAQAAPSSHSSTTSAKESLRSQSIGYTLTPTSSYLQQGDQASTEDMGNQESKPKQQQHKRVQSSPAKSSPLPKPIDIAAPPADKQAQIPQQNEPLSPSVVRSASLADESYQLPSAQYNRPPRLPLPIEEELHTPGSPILSPADVAAVEPLDGLPKRSSLLSNIAADEDDLGDDVDILAGGLHPPVPTLIEWREAGNKVYVTGTFAGWDRKFRLKENGPSKHPGALSATIHLQPGTHHVRFIVDNDLKLSKFMPTAVDFTNYLVNYIEVVPETDKAAAPVEGADVPSGDKQPPQPVQPSDPRPIEYRAPPGVHPPHVLPPTPELVAVPPKEASPKPAVNPTSQAVQVAPVPEKKYHSEIPRFLLDIDTPEDSSRYARANAVLNTAPTPPTLPMFLNKSILNGTTPMKDDASVLNMPNHTMLNHLATSSIKQKVLATSATTRYKRKFLTTIMYKPTSSVGE